jgi:hypothetical protein
MAWYAVSNRDKYTAGKFSLLPKYRFALNETGWCGLDAVMMGWCGLDAVMTGWCGLDAVTPLTNTTTIVRCP